MATQTPTIEEALMPPERIVRVGGKEYMIRRLTLRQIIQLSTLAAGLQVEVRKRIQAAVEAGQPDFMAVAGSLNDGDFAQLLGVLLRADAREFGEITLEETSEIAVALTEVNDFEKFVANFQKAAENAKGLLKSVTPSPSSSAK